MKLNQEIKRMLNALAYANTGDYLSSKQKSRALADVPAAASHVKTQEKISTAPRLQVGLYVGSELSAEVMHYVVQTCSRLRHGLTVLTFQDREEAQALLSPHRSLAEAAGVELSLVVVPGEPPAGLVHALRRRPEIAFLVCSESGYFGRGLLNGVQNSAIPVPVVLVAANEPSSKMSESVAVNKAA